MRPRLSVVVPAYNESQRLPPYLDRIRSYLTNSYGGHYELIVVDDGSQDSTPHLMQELSQSWPQLKLVRHTRNRGKGAAVRTGMLAACGDMLLLADADGATPIDQEKKLRRALEAGADIAVGSRLVPGAEVERRRFFHRRWLGRTSRYWPACYYTCKFAILSAASRCFVGTWPSICFNSVASPATFSISRFSSGRKSLATSLPNFPFVGPIFQAARSGWFATAGRCSADCSRCAGFRTS